MEQRRATSDVFSDDDDENDDEILVSCRCESARVVAMLLACLQHVSPSSSQHTVGQSLGLVQQSDRVRRNQEKSQYATVIVSEKAISFYVYGFGKQSQAMVDLHAGLFSEFYVSESLLPMDTTWENSNASAESPSGMRIMYGGEFGINLSTVLDCLNVLGASSLDRTKLCFTYDRREAIFKIELLEESFNGNGSVMGGSILSTCAIPGMCAPEEDEIRMDGSPRTALTVAYRSSPIVARAVLKSDFLRVAMIELHDVPGAVAATITISSNGIDISTVGHASDCQISLPYQKNHPNFFLTLECKTQKHYSQSYPLHSILTAMKGLDIGKETCISMNAIGMIAIQHQIIDPISNSEPCYVDFIMGCLEDDSTLTECDNNHRYVDDEQYYHSQADRSIDIPRNKHMQDLDDDNESISIVEDKEGFDESQGMLDSSPKKSLFGTVADFGRGHTTKRQRNSHRRTYHESTRINDASDNYEHTTQDKSNAFADYPAAQDDSQLDIGVSFVDVISKRSSRGKAGDVSSPQLMYGETRLEESDNEY